MDASRDLMHVTHQLLKHGRVDGSDVLPFEQVVELLEDLVRAAKPYLRDILLSTIGKQVPSGHLLPEVFSRRRALLVYAFGYHPGIPVEEAQHWFVDRDGEWFWVKFTAEGNLIDYDDVSASHFVETRRVSSSPDLACIACLSSISMTFKRKFKDVAEAARERELRFRKAASELGRLESIVGQILY